MIYSGELPSSLMSIDQLPSKFQYSFSSLNITPMKFVEVLNYISPTNSPANPLDKYLRDIKLIEADDPNINKLALSDLDYVIFKKKAISISKDTQLRISNKCTNCDEPLEIDMTLSDIKFNPIDELYANGCVVKLRGKEYKVEIPSVEEFKEVLVRYSRIKEKSFLSLDVIKLLSLFPDIKKVPGLIEELVLGATHEDIVTLVSLESAYLNTVSPITIKCPKCSERVVIGVDSLVTDLFRDITRNNLTGENIIIK